MIEELTEMLQAFETIKDEIGYPQGFFKLPADIQQYKFDVIKDAYHWVSTVYSREYQDYLKVYNCVKPEVWRAYKLFEGDPLYEDFQEIKLLRQHAKGIRKAFTQRRRPLLFKANNDDGKKK